LQKASCLRPRADRPPYSTYSNSPVAIADLADLAHTYCRFTHLTSPLRGSTTTLSRPRHSCLENAGDTTEFTFHFRKCFHRNSLDGLRLTVYMIYSWSQNNMLPPKNESRRGASCLWEDSSRSNRYTQRYTRACIRNNLHIHDARTPTIFSPSHPRMRQVSGRMHTVYRGEIAALIGLA